jgi:hypothetical protein
MRLRILVLVASALLSLVPALAFADDDAGDNDRAPVVLANAPTTAPATTADAEDGDQVIDRAHWCQTHAEACGTALAAHTDEIVAWCKAHADKCPADELKKALERVAQCTAHPKACAAAADDRADDKHEDRHEANADGKHEDRHEANADGKHEDRHEANADGGHEDHPAVTPSVGAMSHRPTAPTEAHHPTGEQQP